MENKNQLNTSKCFLETIKNDINEKIKDSQNVFKCLYVIDYIKNIEFSEKDLFEKAVKSICKLISNDGFEYGSLFSSNARDKRITKNIFNNLTEVKNDLEYDLFCDTCELKKKVLTNNGAYNVNFSIAIPRKNHMRKDYWNKEQWNIDAILKGPNYRWSYEDIEGDRHYCMGTKEYFDFVKFLIELSSDDTIIREIKDDNIYYLKYPKMNFFVNVKSIGKNLSFGENEFRSAGFLDCGSFDNYQKHIDSHRAEPIYNLDDIGEKFTDYINEVINFLNNY